MVLQEHRPSGRCCRLASPSAVQCSTALRVSFRERMCVGGVVVEVVLLAAVCVCCSKLGLWGVRADDIRSQ
jgi:hypothetical protein